MKAPGSNLEGLSCTPGLRTGRPNGPNSSVSLSVSRIPGGRSEALRAHVEGELWSNPDGACGRSGVNRAGPEAGGSAPHAFGPLLLEGLQKTQRTSLWTADIVSCPFLSKLTIVPATFCSISREMLDFLF